MITAIGILVFYLVKRSNSSRIDKTLPISPKSSNQQSIEFQSQTTGQGIKVGPFENVPTSSIEVDTVQNHTDFNDVSQVTHTEIENKQMHATTENK